MAKKKGDQLRFYCDFRYLNSVTAEDAYPIPRIDESLSKLGDAKFFTTLDLGSAFWQVPLRKQDTDKSRIDKCNEEIWQPDDVLRGRRGNSDTYFRGPHRATRRGVFLHEKSGTKMQAIEVRDTQGLD